MIKVYKCAVCGLEQDVWRQRAENMPEFISCICLGEMRPVSKIYPAGVVFKGGGWTPKSSTEVVLDLGEGDE